MVQNILGGNQYTGARGNVMKKTAKLNKVGNSLFWFDVFINGYTIGNSIIKMIIKLLHSLQ